MAKFFLSVLIDTHNHERFIEQAILSVLAQDVAEGEREIIVVDDGSTDRTPEIVRRFEPRVRLIQKTNGGQASAFNAGIPACSGEGIAFLDGDDWWAPGKLRAVSEALASGLKPFKTGIAPFVVFVLFIVIAAVVAAIVIGVLCATKTLSTQTCDISLKILGAVITAGVCYLAAEGSDKSVSCTISRGGSDG